MESDVFFMNLALKEAKNAFEAGEIPVGAVLVSNDEIIALTRNEKEARSDPTAHAELIAIREGSTKKREWRLTDATLYVTKEPCIMCAGAMINARLGRLIYGCRDERFGAIDSRYQIAYDPFLNHQIKVVSGILKDESAEILKKFFNERR